MRYSPIAPPFPYPFICPQNDAKNAFKDLLASVNCSSEWGWEQVLKLIVNDARWASLYGGGGHCFSHVSGLIGDAGSSMCALHLGFWDPIGINKCAQST